MKNNVLPFMLLLSVVFTGCSYPMEELGVFKKATDSLGNLGALGKMSEEPINFELVKRTALNTCLQCHTSGKNSMDTAAKVLAAKDSILNVVHKETMPPRSSGYNPLNACEKQLLETWIEDQVRGRESGLKVKNLSACGAMEEPTVKPPTDFAALELTFENLKKEILAPKCLACHTQETARRTLLESPQDLFSKPGLIALKAEDSILYQIVVPDLYKRFMPPKNSGIEALTTAEVDYVKRWIESQSQ